MNKHISYRKSLLIIALSTFGIVTGQTKRDSLSTKVVDVVRSYTASIADAYKKREDANLKADSLSIAKRQINYSIYSVPVASTFVPEKGKASAMRTNIKRERYLDSYIGGAFGNANTLYGDASITLPVNNESNLAFIAEHLSSNGDIKGVIPDNNYAKTTAQLRYDFLNSDYNFGIAADFGRRSNNWYGIQKGFYASEELLKALTGLKQTYIDYGVNAYIKLANPYFKGLDFEFSGLSDAFDTSEINVKTSPSFELPISSEEQKIHFGVLLDYYNSKFNRATALTPSAIENKWLIFGANPSYNLTMDNLDLKVGLAIAYLGGNQTNESRFKAYPDVEISYKLLEGNTIFHGGVRGMIQQNTFQKLSKNNPFLAPIQRITPTNIGIDAFGGVKGEVGTGLYYKIKAGYKQCENLPMFITHRETGNLGYQHNNAFSLVYDKVNMFNLTAGMEGSIAERFFFDFEAQYNRFTPDIQTQVWNLPETKASLFTDVKIIENLFTGVDAFYVGNRYDLNYSTQTLTVDGYFDLNFHVDYTINKQFMLFAKVNNLLSNNYNQWAYYPVQGIQAYAGLRYLFSLKKK
ncbi:TonB-dependent receptor [Capnocytophaga sp. H2931]|uniref:TonB-dependent receptor n=1 Tax=Capnocytophaga sp. H2931 TaxID=1945657 RepID=UPI000BB18B67|nr:TonB-dependent receptor [Capnocytophaga sp. H2931]ATA75058.1 TonB-dependent receptor [Capnocytophaga sp. H2931]